MVFLLHGLKKVDEMWGNYDLNASASWWENERILDVTNGETMKANIGVPH